MNLLKVARIIPRKGRALTLYCTAAERFLVPQDALHTESLEALLDAYDESWQRLFFHAVVKAGRAVAESWGISIYREAGALRIMSTPSADAAIAPHDRISPAITIGWTAALWLDFDDAKALQHELEAVRRRYLQKQGASCYVLGQFLTPLSEQTPIWRER